MGKLVPLKQNIKAWKRHFKDMAKGKRNEQKSKVKVAPVKRPITIKSITPTGAALERAKAQLKQTRKKRKRRINRKRLSIF